MDDHELGYLRQTVRDLQRSRNRWRGATIALISALVFCLLFAGIFGLFQSTAVMRQRRQLEMEMQEVRARQAQEEAERRLHEEKQRQAEPKPK